jgi:hypothetical protein
MLGYQLLQLAFFLTLFSEPGIVLCWNTPALGSFVL